MTMASTATVFLFSTVLLTLVGVVNTENHGLNVIQTTLEKQAEDIDVLKKVVFEQGQQLAKLTRLNIDQDRKLAAIKAENQNLGYLLKASNEPVSDVNDKSKRLLLMNQPNAVSYRSQAAFTARLSQHVYGLGNLQALIFDDVVSNFGNVYSPQTGAFTSPSNGTFFFFASIMSHSNEYLETEIVKNGVRVALMYGYGNSRFDQGVNAAVVGLQEGDTVWVRHVGAEGSKVYGGTWCSFSGFQI